MTLTRHRLQRMLEQLLREAEASHKIFETEVIHEPDKNWPQFYSEFIAERLLPQFRIYFMGEDMGLAHPASPVIAFPSEIKKGPNAIQMLIQRWKNRRSSAVKSSS